MSAPDFAAAAPDRAAADLAHEALKLAFSSHRARTIWMARELVMREIPPHALDLETGRLLAPRMAAAGHLHAVPVDPGTLIALGAAARTPPRTPEASLEEAVAAAVAADTGRTGMRAAFSALATRIPRLLTP